MIEKDFTKEKKENIETARRWYKEGLEDKEQEMLTEMKPLLFLLGRIERGEFFEEDDKELNWKKALKRLKNKFKEHRI